MILNYLKYIKIAFNFHLKSLKNSQINRLTKTKVHNKNNN